MLPQSGIKAPKIDFVDGLIVKMRTAKIVGGAQAANAVAPLSVDRMQTLSGFAGVQLSYVRSMSGIAHVIKLPVTMTVTEAQALADAMATAPGVEYAEPDIRMYPMLVPNDTLYANQWHYHTSASHGMNLPAAWDITTGSATIITAVIDTGILPNHADFTAGRILPGYDMISVLAKANDGDLRDADPTDPGDWVALNECGANAAQNSTWHGTHVAGIIGAASNNGAGVAGVDWAGKILPVRVLGKCGGLMSDVVDGMAWAAGIAVPGVPANPNPAHILNLSLAGAGVCGATSQIVINQIVAAGKEVVVAAGNSNLNASGFTPANCNGVITVAAHGNTSSVTLYSNFGAVVEVMAPGGGDQAVPNDPNGVLSTLDGGTTTALNDSAYIYYQGTSMAASHVSGLVSLMLAANSTLTPAQVTTVIQGTVRPFNTGGFCALNPNFCGTGIVDAQAAVFAISAPAAPSVVSAAAASTTQVNLIWTDNATNETGFKIERKTGVGGIYAQIGTAAANAMSYSDATATEATTYYYRVRAFHTYADSTYSNAPNATTLPAAPTTLAAVTASSSQINLSWTDNSGGEAGFKLERKTGVGGIYSQVAVVAANATSYSNTGLAASTEYYYRVRSYNATGNSSYSAAVLATTSAVAVAGGGGSFGPILILLGLLCMVRASIRRKVNV